MTESTLEIPESTNKWLNSEVFAHSGTLSDIYQYIPSFERQDFSLPQPGLGLVLTNRHLDTIVRMPFRGDPTSMPIGVVSKNYTLVQHTEVLGIAMEALANAKIAPSNVKAEVQITEYGERMALSVFLPDQYSFDPGDGNPMTLRLECLNSVERSTRFRVLMGWFRFVCRNGLIIGVTHSDIYRRHVGDFRLNDVGKVLREGIGAAEKEKKNFERWYKTEIKIAQLVPWVDKELKDGLGFMAAARAFHIACTGYDVQVSGQYKGFTPTTVATKRAGRVPGSPPECRNLFDLSQILAWLAKERRDLQEQFEWREKIPELLAPFLK